MIVSFLEMKDVICYTLFSNEIFNEYKLSENVWENLQVLKEFLCEFKNATELISGQNYATICSVIPLFDVLLHHIEAHINSNTEVIKKCAIQMHMKLSEYKGKIFNDISIFAVILDPRQKL